ncbi:fimbria/pilus outer membrane usher protein [Aliivibrio sp. S4TY2]|uniref:fimbria/pilus outer membrane usher protein n=1 Tax=unclassified Aliivibrio TaxID=2645654 RepID=UPI002378DB9E|nr:MULTISPECIES: fimbria/pilus outer membrane usher protein [unclassified Aliivibrio]MDD9155683.1 fimbria/pilus outer membrane usher protein [Aliivibrio sp. S4TY2]MDD9159637.1 fimbria/pilus outer membrane usher protein [Aliivibrio sp. S4TY1]MDD9163392.1 fimbria/pilus outer membrane usher protein [Aliivibrio sp. S4MY2]MDD9167392.1 fimbria/pilus outer membrane usher protein [Aliivibrio sp. S4MY4]MDD9186289.1 fimbria/pilus outer membrane usher protein [Aliivibrio sp. S4MY3]
MDFPIEMQGRPIASIEAKTNGLKVLSINTKQLQTALSNIVDTEVLNNIVNQESETITLDELKPYGVGLTFNSQKISLDLELSPKLMALSELSFNNNYQVPIYSEAAGYTFQNSFNLVNTYIPESNQYSNSLETVGAMNIGGVYGANLIWNGSIDWSEDNDATFGRGPIQLYFDNPEAPYRFTLGEVDSSSSSQLSSISILGIQLSRARSTLRPTEQVTSSPNQEFELTESAEVSITVNGLFVTKIRLPPGRYSLSDLPVTTGANDIVLTVQYLSGREETLTFSNFFDPQILGKGFDNFNLSIGTSTDYSEGLKATYDGNTVISGDYLYGLTDFITIGANGTYHPSGQVLGATMTISCLLGVITFRPSMSMSNDTTANTASLDYSNTFFSSPDFSGTSLRLNAEYLSNYSSAPWDKNLDTITANRYNASLNQSILDNLSLDLTGSYDDYEDTDNYQAQTALNWSIDSFTFKLGAKYEYIEKENFDETEYFLNVRWREKITNFDLQAAVTYDSRYEYTRTELSKNADSYVDSTGGLIAYNQYQESSSAEAELHHVANRFRVSAYYNQNFTKVATTSSIRTNLSTTIAVVDNQLSISPQPIAPIALISVHPSLPSDVFINSTIDNNKEGIANRSMASHVTLLPHMDNSVMTESPMAPIGYNLGSGSHSIIPGSLTGHKIMVGSEYSKTIIATLKQEDGSPLPLTTGTATNGSHTISFFTNSKGRFVIEGVSSGLYLLKVNVPETQQASLYIPDSKELLLTLGDVILQKTPQAN